MSKLSSYLGYSLPFGKAHEDSGASCRELTALEAGQANGGSFGDKHYGDPERPGSWLDINSGPLPPCFGPKGHRHMYPCWGSAW